MTGWKTVLLPNVIFFCIGSIATKQSVLLFSEVFIGYYFDNQSNTSEGDSSQRPAHMKFYKLSKELAPT